MREIWLAACANLSTPPMNPSGMEMHTMNAGRPSCPVESSQTPRGSETSNVQGTTALTSAIHTQLCRNQARVESWYSATAWENDPYDDALLPKALMTWMPLTYSTSVAFMACSLAM